MKTILPASLLLLCAAVLPAPAPSPGLTQMRTSFSASRNFLASSTHPSDIELFGSSIKLHAQSFVS